MNRYDVVVDPEAPNNSHSMGLRMVGWNKRVLELGASGGHITRALIAQNCRVTAVEYDHQATVMLKEVAEAVVEGDLNDPQTLAAVDGPFDVVLAGDVLEHLLDPLSTLVRATDLLAPGGRVVISLPHVAHVDLRLALLQGRFDYHPLGLLDETHIRFFTLKTIRDLVRKAGLVIANLERVRVPPFASELVVDRGSVPTGLLEEILTDPEAETYQFVFTAVRDDAGGQLAELAEKYEDLTSQYEALARQCRFEAARCAELEEQHRAAREELRVIAEGKLMRYSTPLRRVWGQYLRMRKHLGG